MGSVAERRSPIEVPGLLSAQPLQALGVEGVEAVEIELEAGFAGRAFRLRPLLEEGPPRADFPVCVAQEPRVLRADSRSERARVGFEYDGSTVRCQIAFDVPIDWYGGGEVPGPLRRNGLATTLWNTDAWRYGEETPALYQSHPCALALLPDGSATLVIADAFRAGVLRMHDDGLEMDFEAEPFDLYLIEADDPQMALRGLTALSGRIELPPRWALGYHQCRWSYMSADEVLEVAKGFRERAIPCDAIWLDIDHMDRFRSFTFDAERFPDPEGLCRELHTRGLHVVAITDPGVADAEDCELARSGRAGEHFVRDARGREVRGRVWPGICLFPDFTREATRAWWAEHAARFVARGLDGLWLDMNEPAVFRTPTRTLPLDARHAGLGGGSHGRFHNLYGRLGAQATREGLARARPERRPFVLTRSNHLGGARVAAAWTGDNQATWSDLGATIPMVLNLGLSGQAFCGPDLGGFDGDPEPELFLRWFQLGAWLPFARGHGAKDACRKEPWSFGPEVERLVRVALEGRARRLPTLYALFHEATRVGSPIVRPLFFADPRDPALRAVDDAFLFGRDLLVAPVVERGARERRLLLPEANGGWFALESGLHHPSGPCTVTAGLEHCPAFARAGSMLVECEGGLNTAEAARADLRITLFLDPAGRAEGRLFEDQGDGYGDSRHVHLAARTEAHGVVIEQHVEGSWQPAPRKVRVTVHGLAGEPLHARLEDAPVLRVPR